MAAGTSELVERAQIASGREGASPIRGHDDARDRRIGLPLLELLREARTMAAVTALSACGRLSVISPATPLRSNSISASDVIGAILAQLASISLLMITRMISLVPSRI